MAGSLSSQIAFGHEMQLPVDQRDEPIQSTPVPLPPGEQQSGDLAGGEGIFGGAMSAGHR